MVHLILNDGIRRKVWAALYEEKLSKKECVEKFSSVFGKTQMYELFKEFECACFEQAANCEYLARNLRFLASSEF